MLVIELFDLETDPAEARDILEEDAYPELVAELLRLSDAGKGGAADVDPEMVERLRSVGDVD